MSTLAPSFLIGSSSVLQVAQTAISARIISKRGKIAPSSTELGAHERLEQSP